MAFWEADCIRKLAQVSGAAVHVFTEVCKGPARCAPCPGAAGGLGQFTKGGTAERRLGGEIVGWHGVRRRYERAGSRHHSATCCRYSRDRGHEGEWGGGSWWTGWTDVFP